MFSLSVRNFCLKNALSFGQGHLNYLTVITQAFINVRATLLIATITRITYVADSADRTALEILWWGV